MDSCDPNIYSHSFLHLLNSQTQPLSSQNHTNLHQTHPDSTQTHPDLPQTQPDSTQTQTKSPNHKEVKSRWTLPEEKVLVSAWLNTSKDPIVGNEQKAGAFWKRVTAYYAASPSVSNLPARTSNTCEQKWSKLNEAVSKFAGCYAFACRQKTSGQNEDDVLEIAYKMYFQDQKVKFTLEYAWRILKNDHKWCTLYDSKSDPKSKRTKVDAKVGYSSNSNVGTHVEEETIERPIGTKAAKAKRKKRVKPEESDGSSIKELEDLWNIKEKDLAMRDRLANKKLLGDLLSKSGQLTELEESLKNKLICDML